MAYEKHNWVTGEVVTADKLNHIEDGIASGDSGSSSGDPTVVYFGLDTRESTIPRLKGPAYDDLASGVLNGTVLPLGSYVWSYGSDKGASGGLSEVEFTDNRIKFYYESKSDSSYNFDLTMYDDAYAELAYGSATNGYTWTYSEATGEYTFIEEEQQAESN